MNEHAVDVPILVPAPPTGEFRPERTSKRFRGARRQCLLLVSCYLVATAAGELAQTGNTDPAVETIVMRMAQARADNRARFRPYVVTRDYQEKALGGAHASRDMKYMFGELAASRRPSRETF